MCNNHIQKNRISLIRLNRRLISVLKKKDSGTDRNPFSEVSKCMVFKRDYSFTKEMGPTTVLFFA